MEREREQERDKGKERKIGRGVQTTNTKNVREDVGIDLTDNKKNQGILHTTLCTYI